jgi:hypothetical protein
VNSVRSFDGGASWGQPTLLHAPPAGYNAGSPKIGLCAKDEHLNSYKIIVVFLTDAPIGAATRAQQVWPDGAWLGVIAGFLDPNNSSLPINMTAAPTGTVPTAASAVLQPMVFMDIVCKERDAAPDQDDLRVAYTSEGSAWLTDGTLCLSAGELAT